METYAKGGGKAVLVARSFLPSEAVAQMTSRAGGGGGGGGAAAGNNSGRTVQRSFSLPLVLAGAAGAPSEGGGGDDYDYDWGWRASEFLPTSLVLSVFLTVEPKLVKARRERRLAWRPEEEEPEEEPEETAQEREMQRQRPNLQPPPTQNQLQQEQLKSSFDISINVAYGISELLALWGGLRGLSVNDPKLNSGVMVSFKVFCGNDCWER